MRVCISLILCVLVLLACLFVCLFDKVSFAIDAVSHRNHGCCQRFCKTNQDSPCHACIHNRAEPFKIQLHGIKYRVHPTRTIVAETVAVPGRRKSWPLTMFRSTACSQSGPMDTLVFLAKPETANEPRIRSALGYRLLVLPRCRQTRTTT